MSSWRDLNTLACQAADAGDHHKAITYLQEALASEPGRPGLWIGLALSQKELEQHSAAIESIRRAIALIIEPEPLAASYALLGSCHMHLHDYIAAEAAYETSIAFFAEGGPEGEVHVMLGAVKNRLGKSADAEREYRYVLDRHPHNEEAMFNLALMLPESSRDEKITLLQQVIELTEGDPLHERARLALEKEQERQF